MGSKTKARNRKVEEECSTLHVSLPQIEISLQDEYLFHQAMSTCAADINGTKKRRK